MLYSPAQVEGCFDDLGIPGRFSDREIADLGRVQIRRQAGFIAFPTPAENDLLSVQGLRGILGVDASRQPCFFDHPWYLEEPFASRPCQPGWHVIRSEPVAESVGRPVFHADQSKPEALYLPAAVEVVLMLFLHFSVSGERLLARKHTWTRDRTAQQRYVSVGAFGRKGVFISSHEVRYASRGLGICPRLDPPAHWPGG